MRGLGGEAVVVNGGTHLLAKEPAPLGEALADALRRQAVGLLLGTKVAAARRVGRDSREGASGRRREKMFTADARRD